MQTLIQFNETDRVLQVTTRCHSLMNKRKGQVHHLEIFHNELKDLQPSEPDFSPNANDASFCFTNKFTNLSDFVFYKAINQAAGQPQNLPLCIQLSWTQDQPQNVTIIKVSFLKTISNTFAFVFNVFKYKENWTNSVFSIKSLPEAADHKFKVLRQFKKYFGEDIKFRESTNKLDVQSESEQLIKYRRLLENCVNTSQQINITKKFLE